MKPIKNLALMFIAFIIALNVNAQTAKTSTKAEPKAKTEAKSETKTLRTESKTTEKKAEPKATTTSTEKKPRDGRTKTGDPINKILKGPKGETVYSGIKGGNYYLDKSDNKVYLKK